MPAYTLPWLYGVARRVVANELRRRVRASRLTDRVVAVDDPPPGDTAGRLSDVLAVRGALEQLPARDRQLVLLAEWEQLSGAEIAEALGCSQASVRVRLPRARRRLASLIDPQTSADMPASAITPRRGMA